MLLFSNGWVVTEAGAEPRKLTISVAAGRVVRVAEDPSFVAERSAGATEIPVDGLTVVPGLTDAHAHLYGFGASLDRLALAGESYAEVLDTVRRAVEERRALGRETPSEWIEGRGWDQNGWPGRSFPTKGDLDRISPVCPIAFVRIDGHACWANSAALRIAGISKETPDPLGGRILRDPAGEPTGVLVDRAVELLDAAIPAPSDATIERRLLAAMTAAARVGLTEVHDAGVEGRLAPRVLAILEQLAAKSDLPIRVYHMLGIDADPAWLASQYRIGPRKSGRDDRLRVRAVKIFLDGALGSRGAALLADYSDDPGNRGLLVTEPSALKRQLLDAVHSGFQVAVHAIGDRANRVALDTFEAVAGEAGSDPRFRIEHAQVLDPADLPRFARLGVIASMQPTHATSDMPWAEARLGATRLRGAYAWKSLLRSGAVVAGGSDFPIEQMAPSLGLYAAITRTDEEGRPEGGWLPDERLDRSEALALYTTGAARAAFEEGERGRIAPGFRADLTLFAGSPTVVAPAKLRQLPVAMTVVGGQITHQRGRGDAR
jgi:predicted amidohydrolase YtcJ